jgi:predicted PurR-regulated permease PerM
MSLASLPNRQPSVDAAHERERRRGRAAITDDTPRCAGIRGESMSTQPGRTVETARHLHYVLRMGGTEPRTPAFDSVESWNWAVRISVVGLFVVALAGIAYSMASVVVPVLLAWVIAMVLLPVVDGLERQGLSRALTSTVLVILLIASMLVIVGVLTVPLTYWVRRTSEFGALVKERLQTLGNPLAFFEEISNALSQVTGEDQSASAVNLSSSNIVTAILSVLTPLATQTLIFVVALIFHLIYQRDIQSGMLLLFQNDSARQMAKDILKDIQVNTSIYFGTLTIVNIGLGIATTVLTWLVGLPHPFLWGMLAAVLNFVPYLGAAIVIATLFVVGLIAFSALSHAVIAPLAYLGITALEGQVITPTLIGHRLTINPFLVFLSIACWTWMWGPVGAFLGVPILLGAMVALRRLSSTGGENAGPHATAADGQAS